jgi:predicted RNase H-like nuclease (RuvC/YqgF family)
MGDERDINEQVAVHEQQLSQVTKQIDAITKSVTGLPYRIDNLEGRVADLCSKITDLLQRMETKYQTKELCDTCMAARDEKIRNLERNYDRLFWGTLACSLYVLWTLAQRILPSIVK